MNARTQRPLTWLLLVLVAFIATPRAYLHHCELAHHHAASGQAAVLPHCAVCDEALPVSTAAEITIERTITSVVAMQAVMDMVDPVLGHVLACADRGPPEQA